MRPNIPLLENEKILFEVQPKRQFAIYLIMKAGMKLLFLLVLFGLILNFTRIKIKDQGITVDILVYLSVLFSAFLIICYVWLTFILQRHWYFLTNQRCILYSGFWGVKKRFIPLNRIIDVNFIQGPLENMFNIASVGLGEQSSMSSEIINYNSGKGGWSSFMNLNPSAILGITYNDAETLVHLLNERIVQK